MTFDPRLEEGLRQAFKYGNRGMLLLWRLGLGPSLSFWPEVGGRILVISHLGRKSGRKRRVPLNYAQIEGDLYITAGFGPIADWYKNLLAHPQTEVWLPEGSWAATVEDVSAAQNRLPLLRQVLIGSGVVANLFGIDPLKMPDAELEALTKTYRLLRIRRTYPLTGPDAPGDLAWLWPLATLLLVVYGLACKRKSA